MHSARPAARRLVFALLFAMAAAVPASSPLQSWSSRFGPSGEAPAGSPLATRVLADGTMVVVAETGGELTIFRQTRDGARLSAAAVPRGQFQNRVAIDAFGVVFVAREVLTGGSGHELQVSKYDGTTGRRMWAAPAIVPADVSTTAVFQRIEVTPAGDLLLVSPQAMLLDGSTGRPRWGPAGPGVSEPLAVAFDGAGDVVVSGSLLWTEPSPDAYLTYKISAASGALLWGPVRVGEMPTTGACPMACPDPRSVRNGVDPAGNVLLSVATMGELYDEAWATLKYRGDTGEVVWGPVVFDTKTTDPPDFEVPAALVVDGAGDVFVGGTSRTAAGLRLLKYAGSTGVTLWGPVTIGSTGSGLAVAGNGDPVVVGATWAGESVSWTATRINGRTGLTTWTQPLVDGEGGGPGAPLFFGDGSAVVAGVASTDASSNLRTVRFALANGRRLWDRELRGGTMPSSPVAHLVDANGDAIVVAGLFGAGGGAIVKYDDGSGVAQWGPVPFDDDSGPRAIPSAAAIDARGDVLVVGSFNDGVSVEGYWQAVKFSGTDGRRLWGPVRTPATHGWVPGVAAVDSHGDLLAAGGADAGWSTMKYRGSDGSVQWESVVSAPSALPGGFPSGIAIDGADDPVIAGWMGNQRAFATIVKLDRGTGAPLWGPLSFEPHPGTGKNDQFGFLGLDAAGDAIALGVSRDIGDTLGESFLVKFDGESGSPIWSAFVSPDAPYPTGLLLDPASGDAFVRGAGFPDDNVSRWSGRDGSRIWTLDRDVPRPPNAYGLLMVLDAEGSLVVAGTRFPDGGVAIAYDPATGRLRWGPAVLDPGASSGPMVIAPSHQGFFATSNGPVTSSYSVGFGIGTLADDVPPAVCGHAFTFALNADNGTAPYGWTVVAGGLPRGFTLTGAGALTGEAGVSGHFAFRARVSDAAGASAERDFSLDVFDGGDALPIVLTRDEYCSRLEASEGFAAYEWLPGGQSGRVIQACPTEPIDYAVLAGDPSGCRRRGSIAVPAATPAARGPVVRSERRALPREP